MQQESDEGLFEVIVLVTVVRSKSVSDVMPLYDFLYDNKLPLRYNYLEVLLQLKLFDQMKLKPYHVISVRKRRMYRVIDENWTKESLPEFLQQATLLISIFADAPVSNESLP